MLIPHINSLNRAKIVNSEELQRLSRRIVELQRKKKQALAEINSAKLKGSAVVHPSDNQDLLAQEIKAISTEANELRSENACLEESIRAKEEILAKIQKTNKARNQV